MTSSRPRPRKAASSRVDRKPVALDNPQVQGDASTHCHAPVETTASSRRNTLIRTVAAVSGDIAAGIAVAAACVWLIEAAALGLFLSFLVWLLGMLIALAFSQYVVHPAVAVLLSDRKLDVGIEAVTCLASQVPPISWDLAQQLWNQFIPARQR